MDPLCHTLIGATLAQAGLKHRTPFAATTLVLGANAPDVDAITYFLGGSLFWRRGWTHGVLALVLWPFVLAGCMLLLDRVARRHSTVRVDPTGIFWIASLAVLTHPTLDYLNNYGLRWLMPFAGRWFYGDALFIVDPWIWFALAAGTIVSWRQSHASPQPVTWRRPARAALAAVGVYAVVMWTAASTGRSIVREEFARRGIALTRDPMVAPVFASPTLRYVIADDGAKYYVGAFQWGARPTLEDHPRIIVKNSTHPAVARAMATPEARGFFSWSRFPFFTIEDRGSDYLVTMEDARYAPRAGRSWSALQVRVPRDDARLPVSVADPNEVLNGQRLPDLNDVSTTLLTALASFCLPDAPWSILR